jgi:hypothetical protein
MTSRNNMSKRASAPRKYFVCQAGAPFLDVL